MQKITNALFIVLLLTIGQLQAQLYKQIHENAILVDSHNDILTTAISKGYSIDQNLKGKAYTDLKRLKAGGVDVQIFSVFCNGQQKNPYNFANMQIDTLYAWIARNPSKMMLVKTPADLEKAVKEHKLASMIGVEGGHMMEDNLDNLDELFNRGARYMTLTWNNSTSWASSAWAETLDTLKNHGQKKGLNDYGKEIVAHMNKLGMLVDLSHVGVQTFFDAINTSTKPVLVSHSCVYSLCPVPRNMNDDQIRALGKNGGVIQLNFYSGFLDSTYNKKLKLFTAKHKAEHDSLLAKNGEPYFADEDLFNKYNSEVQDMRPPISLLIDHIDYIVKLIGVDHVGLGSDFDGSESSPKGLDGVEDYPKITKALLERGYSKTDVEKILGGNFIRVFKANSN